MNYNIYKMSIKFQGCICILRIFIFFDFCNSGLFRQPIQVDLFSEHFDVLSCEDGHFSNVGLWEPLSSGYTQKLEYLP